MSKRLLYWCVIALLLGVASGASALPKGIALGNQHSCALIDFNPVTCWGSNAYGQLGNSISNASVNPMPAAVTLPSSSYVAMAAGEAHTCIVQTNGTIKCWGHGGYGQLGLGIGKTPLAQFVPANVVGITNAKSVVAGFGHTCALLATGTVKCWGFNNHGQLGNNSKTSSSVPIDVPGLSGVIDIAAGQYHTCAIVKDGMIKCWGTNGVGQLGNGTKVNSTIPIATSNSAGLGSIAISAGANHTCAVLSNYTVQCWGYNNDGQQGASSNQNNLTPIIVDGLKNIKDLALGDAFTCALDYIGHVQCLGGNGYGQLGINSNSTKVTTPTHVSNLGGYAFQIAAGRRHACAAIEDKLHTVKCWGQDDNGQLAIDPKSASLKKGTDYLGGSFVFLTYPSTVVSGGALDLCKNYAPPSTNPGQCQQYLCDNSTGKAKLFAASQGQPCNDGNPLTVGETCSYGSCAGGAASGTQTTNGTTPFTAFAKSVSVGAHHTCIITNDYKVLCWGSNSQGQLGNNNYGAINPQPSPVQLGAQIPTSVSADYYHTCATLNTGFVKCWGSNDDGQLGNSGGPGPVTVTSITNAKSVVVGLSHSCAVLTTGKVYCWGNNKSGQLGNNTYTKSITPVEVKNISTATDIALGLYYSCALLQDGSIKCWGDNKSGQLGNNSTTNSPTPVGTLITQKATSLAVGDTHSCATMADKTVQCWGGNNYKQQGPQAGNSLTPTTIVDLKNISGVALGAGHTCALDNTTPTAPKMMCLGANNKGQLGIGYGSTTNVSKPTPVQITGNVISIAAGQDHSCALILDQTLGVQALKCWGSDDNGELGIDPKLLSTKYSPSPVEIIKSAAPKCGNFIVETGETCDGPNLNGNSCSALGFSQGTLTCSNCQLNKSVCSNPPKPAPTCATGQTWDSATQKCVAVKKAACVWWNPTCHALDQFASIVPAFNLCKNFVAPSANPGQCLQYGCNPLTGVSTKNAVPDGKICDDGNPLTMGEICVAGTCQASANSPISITEQTLVAQKAALDASINKLGQSAVGLVSAKEAFRQETRTALDPYLDKLLQNGATTPAPSGITASTKLAAATSTQKQLQADFTTIVNALNAIMKKQSDSIPAIQKESLTGALLQASVYYLNAVFDVSYSPVIAGANCYSDPIGQQLLYQYGKNAIQKQDTWPELSKLITDFHCMSIDQLNMFDRSFTSAFKYTVEMVNSTHPAYKNLIQDKLLQIYSPVLVNLYEVVRAEGAGVPVRSLITLTWDRIKNVPDKVVATTETGVTLDPTSFGLYNSDSGMAEKVSTACTGTLKEYWVNNCLVFRSLIHALNDPNMDNFGSCPFWTTLRIGKPCAPQKTSWKLKLIDQLHSIFESTAFADTGDGSVPAPGNDNNGSVSIPGSDGPPVDFKEDPTKVNDNCECTFMPMITSCCPITVTPTCSIEIKTISSSICQQILKNFNGGCVGHYKSMGQNTELMCWPIANSGKKDVKPPPTPTCGNGTKEGSEQCDDGNKDNYDKCQNDCTNGPGDCGDGIKDWDEQCDDGKSKNGYPGSKCSGLCNLKCGNTIIDTDAGEKCDTGNNTGWDGCSKDCQIQPPVCGNTHTEKGETCDDGNTKSGDGCSATCLSEKKYCDQCKYPNFKGKSVACDKYYSSLESSQKAGCTIPSTPWDDLACTLTPYKKGDPCWMQLPLLKPDCQNDPAMIKCVSDCVANEGNLPPEVKLDCDQGPLQKIKPSGSYDAATLAEMKKIYNDNWGKAMQAFKLLAGDAVGDTSGAKSYGESKINDIRPCTSDEISVYKFQTKGGTAGALYMPDKQEVCYNQSIFNTISKLSAEKAIVHEVFHAVFDKIADDTLLKQVKVECGFTDFYASKAGGIDHWVFNILSANELIKNPIAPNGYDSVMCPKNTY